MNPRNKTYVNGQEIQSYALTPGSEIQIGDTSIFFQLEIYEAARPQSLSSNYNSYEAANSGTDLETEKKKRFYMIVSIALVLFIGLMLMDTDKEEGDSYEFRNEDSIAEEITQSAKRKQEIESQYYSSGKDTEQYLKAKSNYLQGMREYRERNFNLAISLFSAALSFYPQHELAQRYLNQSRRKLNEEIQYTLGLANSLKDKAQYRRAISQYKHVLVLISDKSNISYKEAKALLEECELRLKGGF